MSIVNFELPDELQVNSSAGEIARQMLSTLPENLDKTEGGFVFDMIKPPALEAAELIQFWLPLALMNSFHMWATGRWLDYCAHDIGMSRREPTHAYGDLLVETTEAVTFPAGFIFSVPSENSSPAIDFEVVEKISTDGAESVTVRVKAVDAGTNSNVAANSITIMKNPLRGVSSITNPAALTGGTEAESDDSLRQRIDDYYAGRQASFVGNRKDYERWAKEVAGVGFAHCIPLYAGANTVQLVIADANGDPANKEILDAVELHIFGTGHDDLERLAPIGVAQWEVAAPVLVPINISAAIKISEGFTLENVRELIAASLKNLFVSLADDNNYFGALKLVAINDAIFHTAGVADFKVISVNGATENISFTADEMPSVGILELLSFD